jgi:hypothetical protein
VLSRFDIHICGIVRYGQAHEVGSSTRRRYGAGERGEAARSRQMFREARNTHLYGSVGWPNGGGRMENEFQQQALDRGPVDEHQ